MRTPRLYLEKDLIVGQKISLDAAQTRYVSQVLRLRVGNELLVFDGTGREHLTQLAAVSKRDCTIQVMKLQQVEPAPTLRIHLWIGISKGDRMDFAIQKSVELGVTNIVPLYTARSVVHMQQEREQKRTKRWDSIISSACQQSGRCHRPTLLSPKPLHEMLVKQTHTSLVLQPDASESLGQVKTPTGDISLLIGPEGGLDDREIATAVENGFIAIRLGRHTLRTETAPIAAIAAIQTLWGDFG